MLDPGNGQRRGIFEGIERRAVVLDLEVQAIRLPAQAYLDDMRIGVRVGVGNDVVNGLRRTMVDVGQDLVRQLHLAAGRAQPLAQPRELGEVVGLPLAL